MVSASDLSEDAIRVLGPRSQKTDVRRSVTEAAAHDSRVADPYRMSLSAGVPAVPIKHSPVALRHCRHQDNRKIPPTYPGHGWQGLPQWPDPTTSSPITVVSQMKTYESDQSDRACKLLTVG